MIKRIVLLSVTVLSIASGNADGGQEGTKSNGDTVIANKDFFQAVDLHLPEPKNDKSLDGFDKNIQEAKDVYGGVEGT